MQAITGVGVGSDSISDTAASVTPIADPAVEKEALCEAQLHTSPRQAPIDGGDWRKQADGQESRRHETEHRKGHGKDRGPDC